MKYSKKYLEELVANLEDREARYDLLFEFAKELLEAMQDIQDLKEENENLKLENVRLEDRLLP